MKTLKNVYNVRSPDQWEIISRHIDFRGKTVLDLGCGKGDLLFRAFDAGAEKVEGIDNDEKNIRHILGGRVGNGGSLITGTVADIDGLRLRVPVDVIFCFSVLPYLEKPERALQWINCHSCVAALIECQYWGDGPGFHFLRNNDDMREWLMLTGVFTNVEVIGSTLVKDRNIRRFIWMCE